MKEMLVDAHKTNTSRTSLLNKMILRAWRERWKDFEFAINVKTALPRGVNGDVYNLADCILQQALIGSNANTLVLSYLKHSLCSHLISHSAVLRRISRYDSFDKCFCIIALLEFLDSILEGITCRNKTEEASLPGSVAAIIHWILEIYLKCVQILEQKGTLDIDQQPMLILTINLIEKITKNEFIMGIYYIGKQEDQEISNKLAVKHNQIKKYSHITKQYTFLETKLTLLTTLDSSNLEMKRLTELQVETIGYCTQPLLSMEIYLHLSADTQYYVSEVLMVQKLKNYSMSRLMYEILRACFISLSNIHENTEDTSWAAFTFFKLPKIFKQLHAINSPNANPNLDYIPEAVEALKMLLDDTPLFDHLEQKCYGNNMEFLFKDWVKQKIINEKYCAHFQAERNTQSSQVIKQDVINPVQSVITSVHRAAAPLTAIIKTLNSDSNKVQEGVCNVLGQALVGNTLEVLLSAAAVEGKLKTFVSRLIKYNEVSKLQPADVGKPSKVRALLFDVTFLMLTFVVQTYGSDVVLSENGDSFFEKWVRDCMMERNKTKNPRNMVAACDENIVDELILNLSKPEAQMKHSKLTWHDICMNIPGVLYQVLIAWENETLSTNDVKAILDNIRRRLFSFSVCAASYLCAYMQTARDDEMKRPISMLKQFLIDITPEYMMAPPAEVNVKEIMGLSFQVIRKMQDDFYPKMLNMSVLPHNIVSNSPLIDHFNEVWTNVMDRGWLSIKSAQILETLLDSGGSIWLVNRFVDEILKCKYKKEMSKIRDVIFGLMHLNIEKNTAALLESVIPTKVFCAEEHLQEIELFYLAHLCVYCVISCLEAPAASMNKKRQRQHQEMDEVENLSMNASKIRKLGENSDSSCSNDFILDSTNQMQAMSTGDSGESAVLKDTLQHSIQYIFKVFANFLLSSLEQNELSPNIYFIFQFITLLVECGKDRVKPIVKLIPSNLIQNLLKVMVTDEIKVGLICRLYDLQSPSGRQSAVSDLCLLRNSNLRRDGIQL